MSKCRICGAGPLGSEDNPEFYCMECGTSLCENCYILQSDLAKVCLSCANISGYPLKTPLRLIENILENLEPSSKDIPSDAPSLLILLIHQMAKNISFINPTLGNVEENESGDGKGFSDDNRFSHIRLEGKDVNKT